MLQGFSGRVELAASVRQVVNNGEPFWTGFADTDVRAALEGAHRGARARLAELLARAETVREAAQQDLIVRVVTRYFDVLAAEDTLLAIHANRLAIARQLEQAKQRFEVGLIAVTDVQESQAAFDQATADASPEERAEQVGAFVAAAEHRKILTSNKLAKRVWFVLGHSQERDGIKDVTRISL